MYHPDASSAYQQNGALFEPNIELFLNVSLKGGLLEKFGAKAAQKVVVIGAGLAGLAAGGSLHSANHHVTILEASDRVGGRAQTFRGEKHFNNPNNYAEAGGMCIPLSHQVIQRYIKLFERQGRFTTGPFNGTDDKSFFYFFGEAFSVGEYERNPAVLHKWLAAPPNNFELNDELLRTDPRLKRPLRIDELWERVFQKLLMENGFSTEHPSGGVEFWENLCARYDMSFSQFLTNAGWKDGTLQLFGLMGTGVGGFIPTSSFLENVRELIGVRQDVTNHKSAQFIEIKGGNDQLATAMLDYFDLYNNIKYQAKVTEIHRYYDNALQKKLYKVVYETGTEEHAIDGIDHVITTTTFPAMRAIEVTPPFSVKKQRAIRELHYQHASKVLLEFSTRFWNTELGLKSGGGMLTDLPVRNIYFPDWRNTGSDDDRTVILASVTWESDALYWASKSAEDQINECLDIVRGLVAELPGGIDILPYFVKGTVKNWTLDPATSGAYAFYQPDQMRNLFPDVVSMDHEQHFHFAGEHASFDHAWMEGALQSGLRAAIEVHDRDHQQDELDERKQPKMPLQPILRVGSV